MVGGDLGEVEAPRLDFGEAVVEPAVHAGAQRPLQVGDDVLGERR
jgi:hypothetical protein